MIKMVRRMSRDHILINYIIEGEGYFLEPHLQHSPSSTYMLFITISRRMAFD